MIPAYSPLQPVGYWMQSASSTKEINIMQSLIDWIIAALFGIALACSIFFNL